MGKRNEIIIYKDEEGIMNVQVKVMQKELWVSKQQIADLYRTTRQNIEHHIGNIYKDGELNKKATCKQLLQVRREGNRLVRRETDYYNLDMIIALGYRIQSEIAVRVRVWAMDKRHEAEKRVSSLGLPKIRSTTYH